MSSSSTGNTTASQNSGSEGNPQLLKDHERKRKRMESNRESAKRSRMRKQKHLDELTGQVAQLRKENGEVITSIAVTTQRYAAVEAENSVLRAQYMELTQRLHSLNEILNYTSSFQINNSTLNSGCMLENEDFFSNQSSGNMFGDGLGTNVNSSLMGFGGQSPQCPIVASADMFDYNY